MVEANVLGQLLLMQSMINNLPDSNTIFSFVCKGLQDVPGIKEVQYSEDPSKKHLKKEVCFHLKRGDTSFGEIHLILSDDKQYEPYSEYIRNFMFMIELILEERRQLEIREANKEILEQRVQVRTVQLTKEIEEKRKATKELQLSETKFKNIVETTNDWLWEIDAEANYIYGSPQSIDILGYTQEEIIGKSIYDLMEPHEAKKVHHIFSKHVEKKSPFSRLINVNIHKDGRKVILESSGAPLISDTGELLGYRGVDRDVTEAKRAEEELHLTQFSINSIADSVFWIDKNADFIFVNNAACTNLGYSREEILSMKVFDIDPEFPKETWTEHWQEILERESFTIETKHQTKEGTLFPVEVSVNKIEYGDTIYNCSIARNITDRKKAVNELRLSEENLRVTLDSIGDGVIATDIDSNITRMNPIAEKLTGWHMDDALGRPLLEVFNIINSLTKNSSENPSETVISTGENTGLAKDTVLLSRDGTEYQIADSGAPILSDTGEILGAVLVFRDVTEEITLQEKLNQSQRLDAIGKLAGGVAHDFNNMLGGILGGAQLLQNYLPKDPKSEKYLSLIVESATRASDLTNKLLTFSSRQSSSAMPLDLHSVICEAISLLENSIDKRITIKNDLLSESSIVVGEASELQNVFLNLGINSSHAMEEGGTITFVSQCVSVSEAFCNNSPFDIEPGNYIEVTVTDTGSGIRPKDLNHIFEPFFTTKDVGKGTGLGLAAAYGTIQQHKGSISVYSELDKGTRFHILLPITDQKTSTFSPSIEDTINGVGTILLVDDEEVIRVVGQELLEQKGYKLILANNGQEAIDIYRNNKEKIDLVILDMIMPVMNGRDCFLELRALSPELPIIIASGFADTQDLVELEQYGCNGIIQKPYNSTKLSQLVAEVLGA